MRDKATFALQFLDNTARFVSPAGAVATTYANATGTNAIALTQYEHAKTRWWDSTTVAYQGWSDGRPVMYFADAATDCTFALTAAAWAFAGVPYTEWVFDAAVCQDFSAVKSRPPRTSQYHLTLPCAECFAL